MDANNEMTLWYLAYIDMLKIRARGAQQTVNTNDYRISMRRRFARWCGHGALRVGTWLLADEAQAGSERGNGSQHQTVASGL